MCVYEKCMCICMCVCMLLSKSPRRRHELQPPARGPPTAPHGSSREPPPRRAPPIRLSHAAALECGEIPDPAAFLLRQLERRVRAHLGLSRSAASQRGEIKGPPQTPATVSAAPSCPRGFDPPPPRQWGTGGRQARSRGLGVGQAVACCRGRT